MMPAPTARNQPNSVRLELLGTQAGCLACYEPKLFIQSESSQPTSSPITINLKPLRRHAQEGFRQLLNSYRRVLLPLFVVVNSFDVLIEILPLRVGL